MHEELKEVKLPTMPTYKVEPRVITPRGVEIREGVSAVKRYTLFPQSAPTFTESGVSHIWDRVLWGFEGGEIKGFSGYGFAILSDGFLNISMWGENNPPKDFPSIVHTQLYEITNPRAKVDGTNLGYTKVNITKSGPYCFWEAGILAHEAQAWRKCLDSGGKKDDVHRYLDDFAYGKLV